MGDIGILKINGIYKTRNYFGFLSFLSNFVNFLKGAVYRQLLLVE
jgi:hypothetical protein